MDLIKWNELDAQIDIAKENKDLKSLGTTIGALEVWRKQYAGSVKHRNKAWKYMFKIKQGMGWVYSNLKPEQGFAHMSDDPTNKQQAEGESGRSRDQLIEYKKYADIPDDIIDEYIEKCDDGKECSDRGAAIFFERRMPEVKPEEVIEEIERFFETDKYKIYNEDFVDVDIPEVDLIITDPPYGIEYKEQWENLALYAKKVLKKNGFLISYFGEINLPTYLNLLREHLYYYWTFALVHSGPKQLILPRNIKCGWKPIVIFQNKYKLKQTQVEDVIDGTGREKSSHEWQQAEDELENLISNFTKEGDVVLDPFMGSGTTISKIVKMNRKGIGVELDGETFREAKSRLQEL